MLQCDEYGHQNEPGPKESFYTSCHFILYVTNCKHLMKILTQNLLFNVRILILSGVPCCARYVTWKPWSVLLESEWNLTQAEGPVVSRGAGLVELQ